MDFAFAQPGSQAAYPDTIAAAATPLTPAQKISRIAELQAERAAAARGEPVYGDPARSFTAILANPPGGK